MSDEKRSVRSLSGSEDEDGAQVKGQVRDALAGYSDEEVARTWRKVDFAVLPVATILYLASYIDRANIGNAKVLGMAKELGLSNYQYNLALSIFFVGYVVFETPSNILLKRLRPRLYIPGLTVLWGVTCALFAVVHSPRALIAIRFFLGLAEGGFLPGLVFWLGSWYPRNMQGRRYAILYSTVSLTGAFGGLLATAIHSLDGVHGIAGWRWIYIVEGATTAGLGLIAFLVMVDYPITAKFLTPREREIVTRANEADRALKAAEAFDWALVRSAFADWRTFCWALVFLTTYVPVYSVILSLPTVVTGLGYSGVRATLMACPPYGLGFIIVLAAGWSADRYGHLYYHYVASIGVTMAALVVLMATSNLVARYIMFFFIMFMFIPISIIWAWASSNVAGSNKRAAATGFIFACGNIGGAISGQIYRAEWAPRYVQGHGINLACYVVALGAGTALWASYRADNRSRAAAEGGADADAEKSAQRQKVLLGQDLGVLGDRHPSFRYYL